MSGKNNMEKPWVQSGSVCLDPSGQGRPLTRVQRSNNISTKTFFYIIGASAWTRVSQASHKIAMYRVAAWRLGPTGQWFSMDHHSSTRLVLHPISRCCHRWDWTRALFEGLTNGWDVSKRWLYVFVADWWRREKVGHVGFFWLLIGGEQYRKWRHDFLPKYG